MLSPSRTYHPFGSTSYELHTNDSEVSLKRYQYVGKERDGESGLYYYGARYYAAWLCRFVSVDPLKDSYPYLTVYNYAGNKPITHYDIDGMQGTGDESVSVLNEGTIPTQYHEVQQGDTYSELAQKYGVTVDELRQWNQYSDTKIPIGANLIVSNPNLKFTELYFRSDVTEGDVRKIQELYSYTIIDTSKNEVIYHLFDSLEYAIQLETNTNIVGQQVGESSKSSKIGSDAALIIGGVLAIALGIALAPASVLLGVFFITSGIISVGAGGGRLGLHIQDTPESNKLAEQVPTNLTSTLLTPVDVARGDEFMTVSKIGGIAEDIGTLFISPSRSLGRQMPNLRSINTIEDAVLYSDKVYSRSVAPISIYQSMNSLPLLNNKENVIHYERRTLEFSR